MIVDRASPQRHMGFNNIAGNVSTNPTSFTTRQVPYDLQEEQDLGTLTAGPAYDTAVAAGTLPGSAYQYEPWVTPTYV
jgi:hypothetical protein